MNRILSSLPIVLLVAAMVALSFVDRATDFVPAPAEAVQLEQWIVVAPIDGGEMRCSPTFDSREAAEAFRVETMLADPSRPLYVRPQTTIVFQPD